METRCNHPCRDPIITKAGVASQESQQEQQLSGLARPAGGHDPSTTQSAERDVFGRFLAEELWPNESAERDPLWTHWAAAATRVLAVGMSGKQT